MLRRATWTRPISDIPRVVSSTCLFRTGLTKHCSFTPCALNSKFWVSHLIVATLTGLTQSCTQSEIRRRAFRKKLQGACQGVPWPFLMVDRGFKVRDSHSERSHITHRPSPQPAHKQCDTLRLAPGYARLAAEALGKLQKCSVEKELLRLRPAEG